ncbi:hypothetical protein QT969_10470 [Rhodococcus sp. CSLK01-03]|uniref:Phage protein Gp19/Gp15/Gp42 n=1 Tax=Rhodococcus indonesiensis TaxID=3055869 RepID=A0ABT7RM46_9NOCA|nr:hypothetical protein [Rhodococcus indonesiensis]MDM7488715.1 hypothetical protein [Rhodococcus indonesiensis]
MALATVADVEARLGHPLTAEESTKAEALLSEASVLVEGFCRRVFVAPIPTAVPVVVSRMVARVLATPEGSEGVESTQMSAGSFQLTHRYSDSSGGPWLSSSDKTMLAGLRSGGAVSMGLVSERTL